MIVATFILLCLVSFCQSECPDDKEHYYQCKAPDEEGRDLSCECSEPIQGEDRVNCSCFISQQEEEEEPVYLDCLDALQKGETESKVYTIKPNDLPAFKAYCDMDGGWTVFQRRIDGSQDFYLGWSSYVHGFGDPSGEFWLGLSKIHRLANGTIPTSLQVDLEDYDNTKTYARYSSFHVGGSSTTYTLHVSGYSGSAADAMSYQNGHKFTTKDYDNDKHSTLNCAVRDSGAWWYNACMYSNLNGLYLPPSDRTWKGMYWNGFPHKKSSEMKTRR